MADNRKRGIAEMLASFLTDEDLNDVKLKGNDGVEILANRFLLSARSKVFKGMLLGKFRESSSPVVELDFPGIVLQAVVEYICTDSIEKVVFRGCKSQSNNDTKFDMASIQPLVSLMEAASYFDMPDMNKSVLVKLEGILGESLGSAFVVLQAASMTDPSYAALLLESAMKHIRSAPFESLCKEPIGCLSAKELEEILKDTTMQMTEYQLFQLLNLWAGGHDDRNAIATDLSKHISFENIDPELLATTVAESGFVKPEQQLKAFQNQAIQTKKFLSDKFIKPRDSPWLPDNSNGNPTKIKVVGAGSKVVNGVYIQDGKFNEYAKYIKQGAFDGKPCVFWVFLVTGDVWYISIPGKTAPGTCADTDFYSIRRAQNAKNPPSEGWKTRCKGIDPPPRLLFKF